MVPPVLDDDARRGLRDAARLADAPSLVPDLTHLVIGMREQRAGAAPKACELYRRLRVHARTAEAALALLRPDPWVARALDSVDEPDHGPEVDEIDVYFSAIARKARVAALRLGPTGTHSVDRRPGSPLWDFALRLAELWAGCGRKVGIGPDTQFAKFARMVAQVAGVTLPERMLYEVARCWRARPSLTAEPQKSHLPSFNS
jgi:hypothetical protein